MDGVILSAVAINFDCEWRRRVSNAVCVCVDSSGVECAVSFIKAVELVSLPRVCEVVILSSK